MSVLIMRLRIFPIPGPSAVATAVSISGFSDKFLFCGFFPEKKQELSNEVKKILQNLKIL